MADFQFLEKFIVPEEAGSAKAPYHNFKHHLFPLNEGSIAAVDEVSKIPLELKEFYRKIGYGFFFKQQKDAFNRLLDPESFRLINLKEDYYENDPDLEIYGRLYQGTKLLFFEIIEGRYLAIDVLSKDNKNAIFYFGRMISDSLEGFLQAFDADPTLLDN